MGVGVAAHQRLLFVSGQVPATADGTVPEGFEAQCEQARANIVAVLESASISVAPPARVERSARDTPSSCAQNVPFPVRGRRTFHFLGPTLLRKLQGS